MHHPPKPPPDVARLRALIAADRLIVHGRHLYAWLHPDELPPPPAPRRPLLLDTDPPPAYDAHETPQ